MARDTMVGPVSLQYQGSGNDAIRKAAIQESSLFAIGDDSWVVILAGGKGTRLAEETQGLIPKPMVEVGGKPLIEHVVGIYGNQGYRNFLIAAGFMGDMIHEWAANGMASGTLSQFANQVVVEDTGLETQTGGRLLRLREYLRHAPFMVTYGDGLADINFNLLLDHHRGLAQPGLRKPLATLTAVNPPARFGNLVMEGGRAIRFNEKSQADAGWINGGFYIMEPLILELIPGDDFRLEYDLLPSLALQGRLGAYQHPGFFQMLDTPRELALVRQMYERGDAPWARGVGA